MRLLELILTLEQGGAQSLLLEKSIALKSRGCFILVVAFQDGATRPAFEAAGIPIAFIRPKRYPVWLLPFSLWELARIRRELMALIQQHKIDIIQSHLLSLYDFLLPSLPNLKARIWTFHNTEFEIRRYDRFGLKTLIYRWLYPRFARGIEGIVAVSQGVKEAIEAEFGFQNVTVIENAIPIEKYSVSADRNAFCQAENIPPDAKVIMSIGRLTEQKGHRYLLDAFAKLNQAHPNTYLFIVGLGELEAELKAQAIPNTRFLGLRRDIPELLAYADMLVFPSLWEGLSQALLEAMAAGKAIIATSVLGTYRLIRHDDNGLLIVPRSSDALLMAMTDVLDEDLAQRLGQSAYQTVREAYDISRLAQNYMSFYQSLRALSEFRTYNNQ
jgi:glycosyltransferase involved in cell wall biosynthesis